MFENHHNGLNQSRASLELDDNQFNTPTIIPKKVVTVLPQKPVTTPFVKGQSMLDVIIAEAPKTVATTTAPVATPPKAAAIVPKTVATTTAPIATAPKTVATTTAPVATAPKTATTAVIDAVAPPPPPKNNTIRNIAIGAAVLFGLYKLLK